MAMGTTRDETPDEQPAEAADVGDAHAVNLARGQSVTVNDDKKRELEDAFPGRYHFTKIEHHPSESPIQGEAEWAWEVRNADEAEHGAAVPDDPAEISG